MSGVGTDPNNIEGHERHDDVEAKRQAELGQGNGKDAFEFVGRGHICFQNKLLL